MEQVILIHSVGQLEAKILLSFEDKAVLLSQDRLCVGVKDEENNVYRMVSELKPLDLHYFLHFGA